MTMGVYTCGECGAQFFSGHKHVCEPKPPVDNVNLVWLEPEKAVVLETLCYTCCTFHEDVANHICAVQIALETFK